MKDTKSILTALFIFSIIGAIGCGPYRGTYLDSNHAHAFIPCPSADISEPAEHAFEAMIATLSDNNWVVEWSNKSELQLAARACYSRGDESGDYLKYPIKQCLVLAFFFEEDGKIIAYNPDEVRFHSNMQSLSIEWIRSLERTYSELRCWSREELSKRNAAREDK